MAYKISVTTRVSVTADTAEEVGEIYRQAVGSTPPRALPQAGEAWEVATFYNQVAAVGHPLQDAYFGEGIQGWLQKATAQVVVSLANQIGESPALNEAVEKWDSFKSYMATQTEQLTKKATWWIWAGIFLAGGWAWSELQRGRQ